MTTIRDEAICVRHWDWSETSQTVSLLTREYGMLRGLAKGSRREKGAFSGGIELLTRGEVVAIMKPRTGLATLTAWDLREGFRGLRTDLKAFHAGMYQADLALRMVSDEDPHPAVFEALASSLAVLSAGVEGTALLGEVAEFQWTLLTETGSKPELEADVRTGAVLEAGAVVSFLPGLGGFTSEDGEGWRTRVATLTYLRSLSRAESADADQATKVRAVRLLGSYVSYLVGQELGTLRPLLASFSDAGPAD